MRFLLRTLGVYCAAAAIGCIASAASADQPEFPYTAYVSIDAAYVHSGPGKRYYPTAKLQRGNAVEVYREDPGGWLAIRPPNKSFSWVPASMLQPTKDHLAVVTGDRVASRVGSRLNDSHNVIQVRLERGEEVEIIAAEPLAADGQQELWCKISPPSGEFRWIYGRFVDRTRPTPLAPAIVSDPPATAPAPIDVKTSAADTDKLASDADAAAAEPFESHLMAVDLALSSTVVQEMSTWRFDELERRAERVLDRARTSDQRDRARQLLDRIAKFEDIQRRSEAIAGLDTGASRQRLQLTAMTTSVPLTTTAGSPAPAASGVTLAGAASRYDAIGKLTTVRSLRPNAPPYALLDAKREPIAFVTPMPGVNLRPLLGHQIGVSGQRGYMPEFQKPHITAMLAEPLDGSDVITALRDQMRR